MSEDKKILIIEDDAEINQLLFTILQKSYYHPTQAFSGTEGILQLKQQAYDLILLDLMLPGMSGEAIIEKIRESYQVPIIVISAKIAIEDKVTVLKLGADDYVTKPFNKAELLARVEVQLRRYASHDLSEQSEMKWRDLKMNRDNLTVTLLEHPLQLTSAEFEILSLFVGQPEHAFSKKEIYNAIWTGPYLGDDNTISVHVSNLRKKMAEITDEEYIKTIWGIGFMLI